MRRLSLLPILVSLVAGVMATACEREKGAPAVPVVEVPSHEPVSVPVRITERETLPPDFG